MTKYFRDFSKMQRTFRSLPKPPGSAKEVLRDRYQFCRNLHLANRPSFSQLLRSALALAALRDLEPEARGRRGAAHERRAAGASKGRAVEALDLPHWKGYHALEPCTPTFEIELQEKVGGRKEKHTRLNAKQGLQFSTMPRRRFSDMICFMFSRTCSQEKSCPQKCNESKT